MGLLVETFAEFKPGRASAIKKNDANALKAVARRFMELCNEYGGHFV